MAYFKTTVPDLFDLRLDFGLILFDQFTQANRLLGNTTVRLADHPTVTPYLPFPKTPQAVFLFFGLVPGDYRVEVRSNQTGPGVIDPPYYFPVDVSVTLPMPHPLWPIFPDVSIADQNKPLDDPGQTAAYREQRALVTLIPTTAYPFPEDATLVRGRVLAGDLPLAQARVGVAGGDLQYQTGDDGEFVIFFTRLNGVSETVTLRAEHALHLAVDQNVQVRRGMTVATKIVMSP
jgi:hypothetical protein